MKKILLTLGLIFSLCTFSFGAGLDSNTKLLLHCDGTNGSTSFPDASDSNHTVTANGDAQVDTAIKKWETGSGLFDGTGDYLSIPDSADWDIVGSNTDTWTCDAWIYITSKTSANVIFNQYASGTNDITFRYTFASPNLYLQFYAYISSSYVFLVNPSSSAISLDTWYHVAVIVDNGVVAIYQNGVKLGEDNTMGTPSTLNAPLWIGASGAGSSYLNGNIDEIRIQKSNYFNVDPGEAENFTPPTEAYSVAVSDRRVFMILTKFIPRKDGGYDRIRENHWYTHKDVKI